MTTPIPFMGGARYVNVGVSVVHIGVDTRMVSANPLTGVSEIIRLPRIEDYRGPAIPGVVVSNVAPGGKGGRSLIVQDNSGAAVVTLDGETRAIFCHSGQPSDGWTYRVI